MNGEQEFKPRDRNIYLRCHLRIKKDITLIELSEHNGEPRYVSLKKGTSVSLIDDRIALCGTTDGCANGPRVRIEETSGVEVPSEYIGGILTLPSDCLELHPNVL